MDELKDDLTFFLLPLKPPPLRPARSPPSLFPLSQVEELMAHIACFPVALKQHLRGQTNRDEIAAVFNTYLPANSSYIDMVSESQSMPSTLLLSMSNVISALRRAPRFMVYGLGFRV